MKAQELRIGNWYKGDILGGGEFQITPEDIQELFDDPQDDFYQPIPLTEEWLLKFKKYSKWKWFGDDNYGGYIDFISEWKLMLRYWDGKFIFTVVTINKKRDFYKSVKTLNLKIEYVHQLQNLYFALTGEELETK